MSLRASRRTRLESFPSSGSHQLNTPVMPISQYTKRARCSLASLCRNWLARTVWPLKRLNFRITQATSIGLMCRSKG